MKNKILLFILALFLLCLLSSFSLLCLMSFLIVFSLFRLFYSKNQYEQKTIDISKLKKGDIVLIGSNINQASVYIKISNILTNGINNKFWSHVAIHIGDGKLIEAQQTGIVYNTIHNYLEKNELVKVYRHKYINSDDILNKVVCFCEQQKQECAAYGWAGLGFYVLSTFIPVSCNWLFRNKHVDQWCNVDNAYFCSELVAEAYKEAGHPITPYDSWRIKPGDFEKNPFFKEVNNPQSSPVETF